MVNRENQASTKNLLLPDHQALSSLGITPHSTWSRENGQIWLLLPNKVNTCDYECMDWHGQVEIDHVWYTPTWGEWILLYVAFCTILTISRQKEARSRDNALLLFRMTSRVLYSAQYHRQHCTLQAFEQFGALYMHNHNDKYPAQPGFEPGTSRLPAPVDTNEPSGPGTPTWKLYTGNINYREDMQTVFI